MSIFNTIKRVKLPRSRFNLSYRDLRTVDFGYLYPIYPELVYPGDRFNVNTVMRVKALPLLSPVMGNVTLTTHFFYIPLRLLIPRWDEFITGVREKTKEKVNMDTPCYVFFGSYETWKELLGPSSIVDYLGFPTPDPYNYEDTQMLKMRFPKYLINAYLMIYNEYYRDENQMSFFDLDMSPGDTEVDVDRWYQEKYEDGQDPFPQFQLFLRSFAKDYFTSALPDAQLGEDVTLPLGGTAPVRFKGTDPNTYTQLVFDKSLQFPDNQENVTTYLHGSDHGGVFVKTSGGVDVPAHVDNSKSLEVDLSEASMVTINDLRLRVRVQEWLEQRARQGWRYVEQLIGSWNEVPDDLRLQRPMYLGGGKVPVFANEIVNTTETDVSAPLGNQAGLFNATATNMKFNRKFKEHGVIMGIMSIMPQADYFQGMPRKFMFKDKFDMYWYHFAHLGEQAIKNDEVFHNFLSDQEVNDNDFGYTPRYAELKHNHNQIHGQFRNPDMMTWHLSRFFTPEFVDGSKHPVDRTSTVNLNSDFLVPHVDSLNRIFPVKTSSSQATKGKFYVETYIQSLAFRKMPRYGTPRL